MTAANDDNVIVHQVELPPVTSPDDWKDWPLDAKRALIAKLEWKLQAGKPLPYFTEARTKQLPPDHPRHHLPDDKGNVCGCSGPDNDWSIWLLMSGRGIGKTYTGSNWIVSQAMAEAGDYAVMAPTFRDVQVTCFTNAILPILNRAKIPYKWRRNELQLVLPNGSVIYGFSADNTERIRGANLSGAWCDELGSWRYSETWYAGLIFALRLSEHPRVVVTTTPRPTDLMLDLAKRDDGSVHLTRGSTWENSANLSDVALAEMRKRYAGTKLGLQELEGQLLEDIEGALWNHAMIADHRIEDVGDLDFERVVVGVDPAVTANENSDETGIVVVGMDSNGHAYVLDDCSLKASPRAAMQQAIKAYRRWGADSIVVEVNNGGDFIKDLLRTIDTEVPLKIVRATRGKIIRAEPASSLYEQGRVHHYGLWPTLEAQMTTFTPLSKKSPDRLDALVWGLTELKGLASEDYGSAYGVKNCGHCGRGFVLSTSPTNCPHCRRQHKL